MRDVYIVGVSMTRFAKFLERSVKDLTAEALDKVLLDAGVERDAIEAAWFSNSTWGDMEGQHCIRGQVALRSAGLQSIPITNVENACASATTALNAAWMGVASGAYECGLALGAEKLYSEDKAKTFRAFVGATDVETSQEGLMALMKESEAINERMNAGKPGNGNGGAGQSRSVFMDLYSLAARKHMEVYGTTEQQLAQISAKNHFHSSMNSHAQFQKDMTVEQVLAARVVSWPLTVPMCAPVGDGAAAAIVCSAEFLKRLESPRPVKILASVLGSGSDRAQENPEEGIARRLSKKAYQVSGVGPEDIDLAEVHDATAFGELHQTEALGFCDVGEGGELAESGATRLGGRIPVNTSGGLECRGHPIGASGLGMNYELVIQLRHEAGPRQVEDCRLALCENGGGMLGTEEAAMCIHVLERVM